MQGLPLSWSRVPDLLDAVLGECQEKQHQPQEPVSFVPEWHGATGPGRVTVDPGGGGVRWVIKHSFLTPAHCEVRPPDLELPRYYLDECLPFPLVN